MSQGGYDTLVKGALLHDVGKLVYRANALTGTHSQRGAEFLKPYLEAGTADTEALLHCVRYHHGRDLNRAK